MSLIDSLSILGLIFIAVVTPFEVAFLETKVRKSCGIDVAEFLIVLICLISLSFNGVFLVGAFNNKNAETVIIFITLELGVLC